MPKARMNSLMPSSAKLSPQTQRGRLAALLSLISSCAALSMPFPTWAQATCSSDGQPQPVRLLERFINADCETCWQDPATVKAEKGDAVLDWVLPGSKGEDAALSAVASRDGLARLETLRQPAPAQSASQLTALKLARSAQLRVAHGFALSGYVGASIELKSAPAPVAVQNLRYWLALIETLPEGTEGSPVERNLVRNVLQSNWDGRKQLSKGEQEQRLESRVMSVVQGVNVDRLRLIGWVEDERGRIVAAAQSACVGQAK